MTGTAEFRFEGDSTSAEAAWKRLGKSVEEYENQMGDLVARYKRVDDAAREYDRSVKRVWESTRTPLERYNAELEELDFMLKKGSISQETYNRKVAQMKENLKGAEQAGKSFSLSAIASVGQFAAAITGVGSAIGGLMTIVNQLKAEYENILSRQKEAAQAQITTEVAQGSAFEALGQDPSMNAMDLDRRVSEASDKYGVLPKDLYQSATGAFSARGSLSAEQAFRSVEVAAQNSPGDLESVKELSQAIIDLQKSNPDASSEQILGMIFGGLQSARVTSLSSYAKNIKGVFQGQAYGDTVEQAMELFSTYTQSMGDRQGDTSATNMIALASQLQEALPELGSTTERIEFLRSPEGKAIRDRLIGTPGKKGTLSIEQQAKTTVLGLLGGDESNPVRQIYAAAQNAIAPLEGGQALFDQMQQTKQASPLRGVADLDRRMQALAETQKLQNIKEGEISVVRERTAEYLKSIGESDLSQKITKLNFDASTILGSQSGAESMLGLLQAQERNIRSPQVGAPMGYGGAGALSNVTAQASDAEQTRADRLLPFINILKDFVAKQQKIIDQQEVIANKPAPQAVVVDVKVHPARRNHAAPQPLPNAAQHDRRANLGGQ